MDVKSRMITNLLAESNYFFLPGNALLRCAARHLKVEVPGTGLLQSNAAKCPVGRL